MKKLKKIKVDTEKGARFLMFKSVENTEEDKSTEAVSCDVICSYAKICDKIKDPRDRKNSEVNFSDFCGEIKDDNGDALPEYIPVEGTIEENLGDISDIFQDVLEKNTMFAAKDIVTNVCSGWCDSFDENFTNCNSGNSLCILQKLLLDRKKKINSTSEVGVTENNG